MNVNVGKAVRLTNQEALLVIEESVMKAKEHKLYSQKNQFLQDELLEYLASLPKYLANSTLIVKLQKELSGYSLSQFEIMQIVNSLPTKEVDLELVVENSEIRLGGEKGVTKILEIIHAIRAEAEPKQ